MLPSLRGSVVAAPVVGLLALAAVAGSARAGWVTQPSGTTVALHDVSVQHGNSAFAWACGDSGTILHTSNGGATWVAQPTGTTVALHGIAFLEVVGGPVVAVGEAGTILRTTDDGATWTPVPSGTTSDLYEISDFGGHVVGDHGTILKTTDSGMTWALEPSGTTARLLAVSGSFRHYAVGEGGAVVVWQGASLGWGPRDSGTTADLLGVPMFEGQGLAVGDDGLLLRSGDFGVTWFADPVGTTRHLRACEYSVNNDSRLYLVGDAGTILKTTDTGATWFPEASGTSENLHGVFFYLNDAIGYAVGEAGTILKTTDGGGGPAAVDVPVHAPGEGDGDGRLHVWPNPVLGPAQLRFALARPGVADVRIYDVRGAERAVLGRDAALGAGSHILHWDARTLPPGTYFVRVRTATETLSGRITRVQ